MRFSNCKCIYIKLNGVNGYFIFHCGWFQLWLSLIADLALHVGHAVVNHNGVLLQAHLLLLQLTGLLLQELHLVQVLLLDLPEVLLQIVDVFENFLQDVVEALCALMLERGALGTQQLRVLLVLVEGSNAVFHVKL